MSVKGSDGLSIYHFLKFYCPMSIIWDLEQSCSSLRTAGFRFQRRQHSSGKPKEVIQVHNQSFLSASQADKGCRVVGVDPVAVQIVDSHFSPVLVSRILQRSCVPAVELSAELEVRSPAAGWGRPQQGGGVGGWGGAEGLNIFSEREERG